jgi:hypothetical protein
VAPVADVIAQGAGFKDQGGEDPNLPAPEQPAPPQSSLEEIPVTEPAPQEQAQPAPMQQAGPMPPTV